MSLTFLRDLSHRILQITHGRTTAFFILFFICGNVMAWFGKLTDTYVGYMMGLGGLVIVHSAKDDLAAKWNGPRPPGGPDAPNTPAS